MAKKTNRAKLGYLNYDEIRTRIDNDDLSIFDVIYTRDTHETILITPELELLPIKSKVYCYPDVNTAESLLNKATDTYAGQMVSILTDDVYLGYIVNQTSTGIFYVSPLSSKNNANLDYNTLGNKPIINLVGTYSEPVLVESLKDGVYSIKGQYKISELIETVYLAASNILFIVETIEDMTYVKKIASNEIVDYAITVDNVAKSTIATTAYIESCGYATEKYVDNKIAALDFIKQEEVNTYVTALVENLVEDIVDEKVETKVNEVLGETIDERIDQRIDERMQEAEDNSVLNLFA